MKSLPLNIKILFRTVALSIFILAGFSAKTQDVKIRAGFISDSVKIGENTAFYLAATHPSESNILFPDSSYNFEPFEYNSKKYFATSTADGISYDSTVYLLSTFEVDSIQRLALPVYEIHEKDCTVHQSNEDEIRLIQLVKAVPDSVSTEQLPLLANTRYHNVNLQFNFYVVLIIIGILLLIAVLIWIFFGKRISNYFQLKKLKERHRQFILSYEKILGQLQNSINVQTTEHALTLWKQYMEQLERKPYTKLTTRETVLLKKNQELGNNLRNIDKAIYGHDAPVIDSLQFLKIVAEQSFNKKVEGVKHGK